MDSDKEFWFEASRWADEVEDEAFWREAKKEADKVKDEAFWREATKEADKVEFQLKNKFVPYVYESYASSSRPIVHPPSNRLKKNKDVTNRDLRTFYNAVEKRREFMASAKISGNMLKSKYVMGGSHKIKCFTASYRWNKDKWCFLLRSNDRLNQLLGRKVFIKFYLTKYNHREEYIVSVLKEQLEGDIMRSIIKEKEYHPDKVLRQVKNTLMKEKARYGELDSTWEFLNMV